MVNTICRLLHIGKSTYYKYKKENYPIINFLHSFEKDDLLELEQTGRIEKLEFANFQNFVHKQSQFTLLLAELNSFLENDNDPETIHHYIDYLAFAFNTLNAKAMHYKRKFSYEKDVFPLALIDAYDDYIEHHSPELANFFSNDLKLLMQISEHYFPKEEGYSSIVAYFIEADFFPLVKACMYDYPQNMHLTIELCIRFNLYKYKSSYSYKEISEKLKTKIPWNEKGKVLEDMQQDFVKFKNELSQIMKDHESSSKS
ncbi:hypothetical protein SJPD1_0056 [Sulfurospirillum diekertiae]|uniref:Uncharacterized protein n=1 Tax=Sulfurospirillum diekertiae TaxID=1854492 RepID=A0A290HRG9_9BACT|nr:hypothetical protein [Sulfurospirillum diekertiae]ATB68190.1 hypothetical protein SJPD1_0056 [Sulfurospirillum diekertiae]